MFIVIINDSCDENAKGRQTVRWSTLFPYANISFIGVDSSLGKTATLEAASNLIDILDAGNKEEGVVSLNVAPRGQTKDGRNGSSFCYFWYGKTLVVTTIKDFNLSLVRKLALVKEINILDIPNVLDYAFSKKLITNELKNYIVDSQFRSYDFQPRVSKWLIDKIKVPHTKVSLDKIPYTPNCVWLIDSFGNAKTTITLEDLNNKSRPERAKRVERSQSIKTNLGTFPFYEKLKDVPDGETAIYVGSSGIGINRLLEIATQNRKGSAAKTLNLKAGKEIKFI